MRALASPVVAFTAPFVVALGGSTNGMLRRRVLCLAVLSLVFACSSDETTPAGDGGTDGPLADASVDGLADGNQDDAAGTCSRDWCVKDPLSCWCGAADAGRCAAMSSPSTAGHWAYAYWVTREDCANHIRFEWFDSMGPHRDVFDLAGNLIGHVDYTDVGLCTAKRYGQVPEETCGPCVLLRGDPNASWPGNPPLKCHPTNDGGVDAGSGSPDGSSDATGDGS